MDHSIVQLQTGSRQRARGSTIRAIEAAWRGSPAVTRGVTAAAVAACAVVVVWWLPVTARVLGTVAGLLVLVAAALVDVAEHRLPNRIVATALVPVLVTLVAAWSGDVGRSALVGAALVGGPLLLTHLASPSGMGFGDVKAGAVLGAAVGLVDARLALFGLVAGLAIGATWGLARRARSVPLGPALVAGAIVALEFGHLIDPEGHL
jgi:leader peptidase (prepilin peptidase)/N-methyltransferase